ncbi:hypothetical protein DFJ58DRAFT_847463 [Suillus subalutaceus]|uniref:uncharacterized protein n=1 Tax=Suillus subalutaceus TaxID=48586 RepID=UPI001B85BF6B|nr:uncharacterized protein DFJ58DRAFT_847463 [Suillus subalutaceus]KAG1835341.1 hypothetical protein DFJ58DRAFT_847463 [Suillus subalutaceus]
MPQPNPQVSTAQVLQEILVDLDSLEHCVHERISEARRHFLECLANCQPNVTMGSNEHYIIAPFETLLDPSLDPAFSGSLQEGTGSAPQGLLLPPQRQDLIVGNAPMITDDEPIARPVQDADDGLFAQPVQSHFNIEVGSDLIASNAPMIADDEPVAQPVQDLNFDDALMIADDGPVSQHVQDFSGMGFQQAQSNSPAKPRVKCSECCAIFNKDNWRRHLNEVHGAKPKTSCDRCGKSFKRKSSHKCKSS